MACSLDCYRESSLVLRAVACDSSGKDLASLRNILAKLVDILVIDLAHLFAAEYADFLSSASASSLHRRVASIFCISHCEFLHSFLRAGLSGLRSLIERQFLIDSIRNVHEAIARRGFARYRLGRTLLRR